MIISSLEPNKTVTVSYDSNFTLEIGSKKIWFAATFEGMALWKYIRVHQRPTFLKSAVSISFTVRVWYSIVRNFSIEIERWNHCQGRSRKGPISSNDFSLSTKWFFFTSNSKIAYVVFIIYLTKFQNIVLCIEIL